MELSTSDVENLWEEGKLIPLNLAPGWLWRLFEPHRPIEDRVMPYSEEELGDGF